MSTETGTFISMDTYEGSIYDPDSLHKYLYANGNPVKYNDPSGNFFSAVEGIAATTINTIADNYRTLQVMGLISGFTKATIAAASGCSPEEITREFIDGYCMGFGVGALMYIAAACTALSIAQIFMFDAGFKSVMYLVLYIVAVTTNHPEDALIYYTLSILSLFTFAKLYNLECKVNVSGDKGSMQVGCDYTNPEEISGSISGVGDGKGIDIETLNFSNTVSGHQNRHYQNSKLLINEIIECFEPIPDPQGTNALYWEVEGSFNDSTGIYELVIDPESNTVWHFVFKSK